MLPRLRRPTRKILVVDDDLAIAQMITMALKTNGYDVKQATDGFTALRTADTYEPDLVILDVAMPRMDGLTVAQHLRDRHGFDGLSIIFLSALTTDHDQWQGWQAGADSYLTKPFDIEQLLTEIERSLASADSKSA